MCTAYELGKRGGSFPAHVTAEAAEELLGLTGTSIIRPTLPAPVILPGGGMETMRWGFRRAFAAKTKGKKTWRTIVNSREDKLSGGTWRDAFAARRCLIPAAAFYEWVEIGGRNVPLRFARPGDGWLWIAGFWEENPEHGRCFSMITTNPNTAVEPVHDRMPAVLADGQIGPYLDGSLSEFGPSSVGLEFREVENFLKRGKRPEPAGVKGVKGAFGVEQPELELPGLEKPAPGVGARENPMRLTSPPCSMPEVEEE